MLKPILRMAVLDPLRAYFRHAPWAFGKQTLWSVADHTWWLETDRDVTTWFGATMHVNARDMVGRYLAFFGTWEPHLTAYLCKRLQPGDVCIDVGANVGYVTLLASHCVGPTGHVYAIEALPATAQRLRDNLARNHVTNVTVIEAAVWSERTTLELFFNPNQITGTATISPVWADRWAVNQSQVRVDAAPLTDLIPWADLARARVIKIDVEGAEAAVLQALPLERLIADIQVEIAPALIEAGGSSWDALRARLEQAGYTCKGLTNDYRPDSYWEVGERPLWYDALATKSEQFDVVCTRE